MPCRSGFATVKWWNTGLARRKFCRYRRLPERAIKDVSQDADGFCTKSSALCGLDDQHELRSVLWNNTPENRTRPGDLQFAVNVESYLVWAHSRDDNTTI